MSHFRDEIEQPESQCGKFDACVYLLVENAAYRLNITDIMGQNVA